MSKELDHLLKDTLEFQHQGKVRDSYHLPTENGEKLRLVVVSDRASIFDFKLGFDVPEKGEILNAFNIAARLLLKRRITNLEQDLFAFGWGMDDYLPEPLRNNPELRARATVVLELPMIPYECVVRGQLTGSAYKLYKEGKPISGNEIGMEGIQEGSALSPPIFTPTTKAEQGHDEPVDYRDVEKQYPGLGYLSIKIFEMLREAARKGEVTVADTKFEFGYRSQPVPRRHIYVLADEVFTPDSSRFWDSAEFDAAFTQGKLPQPLDKQALRNWGKGYGIDTLDPLREADRAFVGGLGPPHEVFAHMTKSMYRAFAQIYSTSLADFQRDVLHIND